MPLDVNYIYGILVCSSSFPGTLFDKYGVNTRNLASLIKAPPQLFSERIL